MRLMRRYLLITIALMALGLNACAFFGFRSHEEIPANLTVYFRDQAFTVSLPVQIHLADVADYLRKHRDWQVEVAAHAGDSRRPQDNQETAALLSDMIGNHLLGLGVPSEQVQLYAYGIDGMSSEMPYVRVRLRSALRATEDPYSANH